MKKILILDNYDSFTFNLVQLVQNNSQVDVSVKRNDKFSLENVKKYDGIILSPGPGVPNEAGLMPKVVESYHKTKPILGVCLGHQCLGEFFGAQLINLEKVFHGKATNINVTAKDDILYSEIPRNFTAGRYHSWVVDKESISEDITISALDDLGYVMSISHKNLPIYGVQYHPESVMTDLGQKIINNWLSIV